jgi:hypothetical protein
MNGLACGVRPVRCISVHQPSAQSPAPDTTAQARAATRFVLPIRRVHRSIATMSSIIGMAQTKMCNPMRATARKNSANLWLPRSPWTWLTDEARLIT